jgi:hypothetical protein
MRPPIEFAYGDGSLCRVAGRRGKGDAGGSADHLGGPREVVELPVSHTDQPEEKLWDRFEAYWLRLALEGVPATFGEKDTPTP